MILYLTPDYCTRVGAIPEQIEDKQTGLLADPGSADQLCQAMEHLLNNPELAQRLGRNLAERSNQNASWDTVAGRFIGTCEKAIGR